MNTKDTKDTMIPGNSLEFPAIDYSKELDDDETLQKILVMSENLNSGEFDNLINEAVDFLVDKIIYLQDLQKAFGIKNRNFRLKRISEYLDLITVQGNKSNSTMNDFSYSLSLTLDVLYSTLLIFENYIKDVKLIQD